MNFCYVTLVLPIKILGSKGNFKCPQPKVWGRGRELFADAVGGGVSKGGKGEGQGEDK